MEALLLLLLLLGAMFFSPTGAIVPSSEVSEFLQQHGLPGGLLPDAVSSYSLSEEGEFVVHLEHECFHKFENEVWYGTSISGKLSYGKIEDLSGIQAKELLFIWLPVTGIQADGSDYVLFEVGPLSKKLAASLFDAPPACENRLISQL